MFPATNATEAIRKTATDCPWLLIADIRATGSQDAMAAARLSRNIIGIINGAMGLPYY